MSTQDRLFWCLLGTAVGDALGLPFEGLPPHRVKLPLRHRFLWNRGMVSDDTEHTILTLESLRESSTPADFQRRLAWKLRVWFLMLPAGVGFATLRACLRLWLGVSPDHSGVVSAGNGPAMRAAIIGCWFSEDEAARTEYVRASSVLTHRDPRAEEGAQIVALAASRLSRDRRIDASFFMDARALALHEAWEEPFRRMSAGEPPAIGSRGVSGYIVETVEACLGCLREGGSFTECMSRVIAMGGDTDTTGAILGGVLGCQGSHVVPAEWTRGLVEWPRSREWMRRLSHGAVPTLWPGVILRNVLFLTVVLWHGLLRLVRLKA